MFAQALETRNRLSEHPQNLEVVPPKQHTPNSKRGTQCRICLSGVQTQDNPLIAPCQCTGSLQFVHEECIKEWVQRKLLREQNNARQQSLICELCKSKIQLEVVLVNQCRSRKNLVQIFKRHFFSTIIILIGLLTSIGLFIFTSYYLSLQVKAGYSSVDLVPKIIILVAFGLNFLLIFYIIYSICGICLRKRAKIMFKKS